VDALETFRRMWDHAAWADGLLLSELEAMHPPPALAWREYAHVLGAESTWLDRLLQRPARFAVWPELSVAEASSLAASLRAEYSAYVANSAGRSFDTAVSDILLQVALHGQYHRGKINLLLRQAHLPPTPTDYIAFARGVPAAVTDLSGR
jgi:uncharacterized damage-inducible protein DinB